MFCSTLNTFYLFSLLSDYRSTSFRTSVVQVSLCCQVIFLISPASDSTANSPMISSSPSSNLSFSMLLTVWAHHETPLISHYTTWHKILGGIFEWRHQFFVAAMQMPSISKKRNITLSFPSFLTISRSLFLSVQTLATSISSADKTALGCSVGFPLWPISIPVW